ALLLPVLRLPLDVLHQRTDAVRQRVRDRPVGEALQWRPVKGAQALVVEEGGEEGLPQLQRRNRVLNEVARVRLDRRVSGRLLAVVVVVRYVEGILVARLRR